MWSSQQECYFQHSKLLQSVRKVGMTFIIKEGSTRGPPRLCCTPYIQKDEGMNIAVQWQDADSSSKAVTDHFPDAKIMICGGHAGSAHKKQLEKLQKTKSFTDLIRKYRHFSHCWQCSLLLLKVQTEMWLPLQDVHRKG